MPAALLVVVTASAAVLAASPRVQVALASVIGVTLLVPDTLLVPAAPSSYLTVHRVVLVAFVVGLGVRAWRDGAIPRLVRPTAVHVAFVAFLAVALAAGVAHAPAQVRAALSVDAWILLVEQLVFLVAVAATIRRWGDLGGAATLVAALAVVLAGVGVVEHVVGSSWARWWFRAVPEQLGLPGTFPLEQRGGSVRVRAAAPYALAYGWQLAMLLPVVVAVGLQRRRAFLVLAVPVVAASAWTYSRSAYAGIAIGLVVLTAVLGRSLAGRRRTSVAVVLGGAAVIIVISAVAYLSVDAVETAGSDRTRVERLPRVLAAAAEEPWAGVGLGGLEAGGIRSVDSSFVLLYAETGVLGVTALGALLAVAVMGVALGARSNPSPAITGAALGGLLAGLAGAAAFDLFSNPGTSRTLWLVVALGMVAADDRSRSRRAAAHAPPSLAALGRHAAVPAAVALVGLAGGFVARAAAPEPAVSRFRFQTINVGLQAVSIEKQDFFGRVLVNTACEVFEVDARRTAGATADCFQVASPGIGEARVAVDDHGDLEEVVLGLAAGVRERVPGFRGHPLVEDASARPTWATTAPFWAAVAGLVLGVMVQSVARRARRRV